MDDERKKRLKALRNLSNRDNDRTLEEIMPVSGDSDYFDKLKNLKSSRVSKAEDNSEESFNEMLDKKEDIEDEVQEGLSWEDKERIAAETLKRKKKEAGIPDKELTEQSRIDEFKLQNN